MELVHPGALKIALAYTRSTTSMTFLSYIDSDMIYDQFAHPVDWVRPKLKHEGILAEEDGKQLSEMKQIFSMYCTAANTSRRTLEI